MVHFLLQYHYHQAGKQTVIRTEKIDRNQLNLCCIKKNSSLKQKYSTQSAICAITLKQNTVKPLSIVPVTVVRPHVSSALFGPEISPI
jgi:hypothetical protein